MQELLRIHRARLVIQSTTAAESSDGHSGSSFTVYVPLGSSHLAPEQIQERLEQPIPDETHLANQINIKGVLEEANMWASNEGGSTMSEVDSTSAASSSSSTRSERLPLFFVSKKTHG